MHHYGYIPDQRDQRDRKLPLSSAFIPSSVDLRPLCPAIYDQAALGSCTANAIAGAIEYDRKRQQLPDFVPSRLFIYYNERQMEGTVLSDAGATIRDGIKSVNRQGACDESEWPYDISAFSQQPTSTCYVDAKLHRTLAYARVSMTGMKSCLAAGYPIVFGFTVYESFETDIVTQTGVVPMPAPDEAVLGGHAMVVVGYDDAVNRFLVRNSWGTSWGMDGYGMMPYAYLGSKGLASDFWTIRVVE